MAFDGTNGALPEAALIEGSDGSFYGTTIEGGAYTNFGTVFETVMTAEFSPDGHRVVTASWDIFLSPKL
jgi:uncharacterized repeat protein (TIGR03803 family)